MTFRKKRHLFQHSIHLTTILLLTLVAQTHIHAQAIKLDWVKSMGSSPSDYGTSMVIDSLGNSYSTGVYQNTVDFDPGPSVNNLTSNGFVDIYIQKFDASGNLVWAKSVGGTSVDIGFSIALDVNGDVYITGFFIDTVDFDPGINVFNLVSNGNEDVFVLKLNANGDFLWAKSFGGIKRDSGFGITTDTHGGVYLTGGFRETSDFDPGPSVFNMTANGFEDIFVLKLTENGDFRWANSMGGGAFVIEYGNAILTDHSGDIFVSGIVTDSVNNIFIQKLDSNGNILWSKNAARGMIGNGISEGMATDANGNIYIVGSYQSTMDFDPGPSTFSMTSNGLMDIFVSKLSSTGDFRWAKSMGSPHTDRGEDIDIDEFGNIYLTGSYSGTVDFDPGPSTFNLTSLPVNATNMFIQKLDTNGSFVTVKTTTGAGSSYGESINVLPSGDLFLTGYFFGLEDFNPSPIISNLVSNGLRDIFVQKLFQCVPSNGLDVVVACDSYQWINGITYSSSNNSATFNLECASSNGCDSIVTLNLTITNGNSSFGVDTQVACDSLIWIDGNTYTSNNTSAIHTLNDANVNGCDSIITLNLTIVSVDTSVTISNNTLTAVESGATYQWLDCNNNYSIINGAISKNFVATNNGDYAVEVTKNGCSDTSSCFNVTITGVNENALVNKFNLYPNPVKNQMSISFDKPIDNTYKVIVQNSLGQAIQELKPGLQKTELNLSTLDKGIYYIKVFTSKGNRTVQIIKQ